jgi:hypothetical protein
MSELPQTGAARSGQGERRLVERVLSHWKKVAAGQRVPPGQNVLWVNPRKTRHRYSTAGLPPIAEMFVHGQHRRIAEVPRRWWTHQRHPARQSRMVEPEDLP